MSIQQAPGNPCSTNALGCAATPQGSGRRAVAAPHLLPRLGADRPIALRHPTFRASGVWWRRRACAGWCVRACHEPPHAACGCVTCPCTPALPTSQWLLLVLRLLALPYFAIYFVLQGPVNDNLGAWWLVSPAGAVACCHCCCCCCCSPGQAAKLQPSYCREDAASSAARHFCPAQWCWMQGVSGSR